MSLVFTNVQALAGSADLTGQSNEVGMQVTLNEIESTTFGSAGWREYLAGLGDTKGTITGNWSPTVDDVAFAGVGVAGTPITVVPGGNTVGNVAYTLKTLQSTYDQGAKVGDLAPFTMGFAGVGVPVRGALLHPTGVSRTSTGTGTAVNLGAATAGQSVYAALHVLAASGTTPTLDITIEADTANTFPAPVTVGSFATVTATGSQWVALTAPSSSDIYYRVSYVLGGTTPSFQFAVAAGFA